MISRRRQTFVALENPVIGYPLGSPYLPQGFLNITSLSTRTSDFMEDFSNIRFLAKQAS